MATTSKDNKENPVLKQEKDRLAREFVHLEKTQKTGMLSSQEYTTAKKSLEKKQRFIEQKEKQETAKEKAVEEILGSASILPVSSKASPKKADASLPSVSSASLAAVSSSTSEHSSEHASDKKRHQKYFMKLDTPKHPVSQHLENNKDAHSSQTVSVHSKKTPDKHSDKKTLKRTEKKKEPETLAVQITSVDSKSSEQHPAADQEVRSHGGGTSSLSPSFNSSAPSPYPDEYKDIDELTSDDENHWRFALALLTIFLLILLYVKFTSYGSAEDVITVDAYLDPTSSYSKDMYLALQSLIAEYGDVLWVDYHLIGVTDHALLISHAMFCAQKEGHGTEYLSYYFAQDVLASDAKAISSYAPALGLDSAAFETCLSDASYPSLYDEQQKQAEAQDITYTPTLLINNKKIVGAVGADAVSVVLDQELVKMG